MNSSVWRLAGICWLAAVSLPAVRAQERGNRPPTAERPVVQSDPAKVSEWLQKREREQGAAAADVRAFHNFQFSDRWQESGVRFEHHAVADANKYYKPI